MLDDMEDARTVESLQGDRTERRNSKCRFLIMPESNEERFLVRGKSKKEGSECSRVVAREDSIEKTYDSDGYGRTPFWLNEFLVYFRYIRVK
uniref:Uncharacterized protein n=1 Tax=Vespula pensylvanica TaxID=30213 RepID=A0A834NIX0_VESPE|nr:hypothetical protein H0235_013965 [Vespula pensylvanica]